MSSEGDGDWGVRKSAQYIAENSEHVSVKQEGVEELATHLFSRISSSALSPMVSFFFFDFFSFLWILFLKQSKDLETRKTSSPRI